MSTVAVVVKPTTSFFYSAPKSEACHAPEEFEIAAGELILIPDEEVDKVVAFARSGESTWGLFTPEEYEVLGSL